MNKKLVNYFECYFNEFIERTALEYNETVKDILETNDIKFLKKRFICDIFEIDTYSPTLDEKFGGKILEIIKVIANRENFRYINISENNYEKFIVVANLLSRYGWIEWGSSIRGCWIDEWEQLEINDIYGNAHLNSRYTDEDIKDLIKYLDSNELYFDNSGINY